MRSVPGSGQSRSRQSRFLIWSHAQDEIVIARAMTDRQEQPPGVGTHLTILRLICYIDTHPAGAAAQAPDVFPGQCDSLTSRISRCGEGLHRYAEGYLMPGRYSLTADLRELARRYDLAWR